MEAQGGGRGVKVVDPLPPLPTSEDRQRYYDSLQDFVWILKFTYVEPRECKHGNVLVERENHQTAIAVEDGVLLTCIHGGWDTFQRLTLTGKPLSAADRPDIVFNLAVLNTWIELDMCLLVVNDIHNINMRFPRLGFGNIEPGDRLLVIGHPHDYPGSAMYGQCCYGCGGKKLDFSFEDEAMENRCLGFPRRNIMQVHGPRIMGDVYNREFFKGVRYDPVYKFQGNLLATIPIIQCHGIDAGPGCSGAPVFNMNGELVGMHVYGLWNFEVIIHVEAVEFVMNWFKKMRGEEKAVDFVMNWFKKRREEEKEKEKGKSQEKEKSRQGREKRKREGASKKSRLPK